MRAALAAAGLVGVVGTVIAADMTGDEIKATISGKTVYLECGATSTGGQGQGIIYYAADGGALYKSASKGRLLGTWSVKGNTSCTDWKEVPSVQQIRQTGRHDYADQRCNQPTALQD
jgi:hypothetical protein